MRFLTPSNDVAALSPLHADLLAAGATFELRDGWQVATGFDETAREFRAVREAVGWADCSNIGKLELFAQTDAPLGTAERIGSEWWCPVTPDRTLVLTDAARRDAVRSELAARGRVLDLTTQYGALALAGPAARETIARFCAIDLRPAASPPGAFRPGSLARTPGAVLVEAPDRYLLLFGAAVASYLWTVVSDAGTHLGGRPVGVDALRAEELVHA